MSFGFLLVLSGIALYFGGKLLVGVGESMERRQGGER